MSVHALSISLEQLAQNLHDTVSSRDKSLDDALEIRDRAFNTCNHRKILSLVLGRLQAETQMTQQDFGPLAIIRVSLQRFADKAVQVHKTRGAASGGTIDAIQQIRAQLMERINILQRSADTAGPDRSASHVQHMAQLPSEEDKERLCTIAQNMSIAWHIFRSCNAVVDLMKRETELRQAVADQGGQFIPIAAIRYFGLLPPLSFFSAPIPAILLGTRIITLLQEISEKANGLPTAKDLEILIELTRQGQALYPDHAKTFGMYLTYVQWLQCSHFAKAMWIGSCVSIEELQSLFLRCKMSSVLQNLCDACEKGKASIIEANRIMIHSLQDLLSEQERLDLMDEALSARQRAVEDIVAALSDPIAAFRSALPSISKTYASAVPTLVSADSTQSTSAGLHAKIFEGNVVYAMYGKIGLPSPEEILAFSPLVFPLLVLTHAPQATIGNTLDAHSQPPDVDLQVQAEDRQHPSAPPQAKSISPLLPQKAVRTSQKIARKQKHRFKETARAPITEKDHPSPKHSQAPAAARKKLDTLVGPVCEYAAAPQADTSLETAKAPQSMTQELSPLSKGRGKRFAIIRQTLQPPEHHTPFTFRIGDRVQPSLTFAWHVSRWHDRRYDPFVSDPQYSTRTYTSKIQSAIRFEHTPPLALLRVVLEYGKQFVDHGRKEESRYLPADVQWDDGAYDQGVLTVGRNLRTSVIFHIGFSQLSPTTLERQYLEGKMFQPLIEVAPKDKTGPCKGLSDDTTYVSDIKELHPGMYAITVRDPVRRLNFHLYVEQ
jgi:hypothetical protein